MGDDGDWEDPWFVTATPRRFDENLEQTGNVTVVAVAGASSVPLPPSVQPADAGHVGAGLPVVAGADAPHNPGDSHNNHSQAHGHAPAHPAMTGDIRRGVLFAKPRLVFDWGQPDKHRKVDWSELFGDLIIVAVALKISSSVKEELSWATIGVTFVSYALYWEAWLYVAAYMSRFASQDLFFKIWHVVYVCGSLTMAIYMDPASSLEDAQMGFSLAKIATLISITCLYAWNSYHLPRVAPASFRMNCGYVLGCAPLVAAIFTKPGYVTIIMWIISFFVMYAFQWWSWLPKDGKRIAIPIHIEHMDDLAWGTRSIFLCVRVLFHAYVMIVLGESILAQVLVPREKSGTFWVQILFGIIISYVLHVMYFESQPFSAALHASRRSVNAGRFYTFCHLPLTYFMVLVGAGLKVLLYHSHYELHRSEVWLLGGSLTIVVALILLVRMSHRGWRSELGLLRSTDPGFVIASNGRCQRARAAAAAAAAAATKPEPAHPHIMHAASAPNLTHQHVEHAPVHLPDGATCPDEHAKKPSALRLLFSQDTTMRRRLLWSCRAIVVLLYIGWTLLVGERTQDFSSLSFTGGLAFLCCLLHAFEYPDVMSYSDKVTA